ncbi:hypothetical protein [Humibacter albus]|uniref:hypothetical protein n=1 Tax=Humibacter albus TaxID=427754 RepID=UPI0012FB1479|nr:hypothetical protein [Humibacter albus]
MARRHPQAQWAIAAASAGAFVAAAAIGDTTVAPWAKASLVVIGASLAAFASVAGLPKKNLRRGAAKSDCF